MDVPAVRGTHRRRLGVRTRRARRQGSAHRHPRGGREPARRRVHPRPRRLPLVRRQRRDLRRGGAGDRRVVPRSGIMPWLVLDEGGAVVDSPLPFVPGRAAMVGVGEKGVLTLQAHRARRGRSRVRSPAADRGAAHRPRARPARRAHVPPAHAEGDLTDAGAIRRADARARAASAAAAQRRCRR